MIMHAAGGGTGSGVTNHLLQTVLSQSKDNKLAYTIFSSPNMSTSCVEPYNSVLSLADDGLLQYCDMNIMMDNE